MTKVIEPSKYFDQTKPNKATKMVGGESSGLLNWEDTRNPQAYPRYKELLGNFWTPFEINMTNDTKQYKKLSEVEVTAFRRIIALLAILDSVQSNVIGTVSEYLSDTSYKAILTILAQQEVIHNHSYSYILSSVETKENQDLAFEIARTDPEVYKRNSFIIEEYENFRKEPTVDNLVKVVSKFIILEGINFYSGFTFFYHLARNQKMVGTSTMISYINRDELKHIGVAVDIINDVLEEHEISFDFKEYITEAYKKAAELEIAWSKEVLNDIVEIDLEEVEGYIKFRANKCANMIGVDTLYEGYEENPMLWIKAFVEDENTGNNTKTDFFENKSRQYVKVSDDNGFDDL